MTAPPVEPASPEGVDERLRTSARLLNAVAQAVVAWDLDGRITYLNDAASAMYGWPKDVAIGAQAADLSRAELSPDQLAMIADTLAAGRTWSGEITVGRADGTTVPVWASNTPVVEDDATVGFIGLSLDITERKTAEALVWHRATHDTLTDLANHRSLTDQLGELLGSRSLEQDVTVVLVDIGSMDVANDTYGHAVGQGIIQQCAEHLGRASHVGDLLARFADHTFAVVCSHGIDEDGGREYGERLRSDLSVLGAQDRPAVHRRVAAAVSSAAPGTVDADELLQRASTALTQAKRGASTQVYDASMRADLDRRNQVGRLVEEVVARGEVRLGYQPVVRLHDEVTVGAEALLRLLDLDGTAVPAVEVVRAAERTGRMVELGELVLRQACTDAAAWQAAAPDRSIGISVNVSASQLDDPHLASRVRAVLASTGLAPSALWLEITESALMRDPGRSAAVLVELKGLGVRLSADDFGTGYSSLAYLKRFPLDLLKVDQSFVAGLPHNLEDHAIVMAVMAMADALGLTVVAEGVETEAQLRELRIMGAPFGQGFLWSPAISAEDLRARLLHADDGAPVLVDRVGGPPTSPPSTEPLVAGATSAERIDSVLALLAHEVRGPLTVITGYASLLEEVQDPEEARAGIAIGQAALRIDRILTTLVAEVALGPSASELAVEPIDAVDLVRLAAREAAGALPNPVRGPAEGAPPLQVAIDVGQVQQALQNLIGNASKFSPPGSPIELDAVAAGAFVDLTVGDEGPGIDPGQLGLVFRKYGRATDQAEGTGIGLFVARHVARAHGGDVLYRRRPDRPGSILVLRLPALRPGPAPG